MKRLSLVLIALLITASLSGCGDSADEYSESTLVFSKKGAVTDVIIEPFEKDYYDEAGLSTFFNEKINDFQSSSDKGTIILSSLKAEKGIAKAVLDFDCAKTYQQFYNTDCFYGTINDAYDSGYGLNVTLKEINGTSTIKKEDIMEMQNKHIIIVAEPINIVSKDKIKYTSANVEVINNKNVRISSDSSGLAYLILE